MGYKDFLKVYRALYGNIERLFNDIPRKEKRRLASYIYRDEKVTISELSIDEVSLYILISVADCRLILEKLNKYRFILNRKKRKYIESWINKWIKEILVFDSVRTSMLKLLEGSYPNYTGDFHHLDFTSYHVSHINKKIIFYDKEEYFGEN